MNLQEEDVIFEYLPSRVQSCIDHIKTSVDVDPWAKIMCEKIMKRAIPVKPTGKYTQRFCGRCGSRVRSGAGSSSFTRDTVCRKCFTVIDWEPTLPFSEVD